jgi:hypothetical protein
VKTHSVFIKNISIVSVVISLTFSSNLWAKRAEYVLELKDHLFFPAVIQIPANEKVKLIIYNRDTTPEEFDSFDLNREKVIFPNRKAVIFIGPLPEGEYHFFGEFNPNSAKGIIEVVPISKNKEVIEPTEKNKKGGS